MGFTDKLQFQDFTAMITYFVTNQPTQVALTCLKPTMETPEHSEMLLKLTFTFIVKWELMSFWCL